MQTIRAKLILALVVTLVVLVPAAAITLSATTSSRRTSEAVAHSADILHSGERLLLAAVESETGVRGFVISGEERFLEPWNSGRASFDAEAAILRGLEATRQIMARAPRPIVLVSGVFTPDLDNSFRALEAGAVTLLEKPSGPGSPAFARGAAELVATVKLMAGVKLVRRSPRRAGPAGPPGRREPRPTEPLRIVAVAASTGGPPAVAQILRALPADWPVPILVVQHIGVGFDAGLVRYLDECCPLPVALAEDGREVAGGQVYVSPAEAHLGVTAGHRLCVTAGEPIDGYRPSANHLFRSVAAAFGAGAAGVVLTGMGRDGADGLLTLRQAGGLAIAQDETTSIVYGMPRQALLRGAAAEVLPVEDIARALIARAPR